MKKFFYIGGLIIVLLFNGCREKVAKGDFLRIWLSYNNTEYTTFLKIAKLYTEKTGLKIKAERVPFAGLQSKLFTAAIAGKTPDIARVDIGNLARFAYGKLAAPLSEFAVDEVYANMLTVTKDVNTIQLTGRNGRKKDIYGISDQITALALFYNKDHFKEAGLNPTVPPKTWPDFIKYSKILQKNKKERYGTALNLSLWWYMPFLYAFDGDILNVSEQKCLLNQPGAVNAISFIHDLYAKDKVEAGAWRAGAINPDQGFINNRYSMIFSGPWNLKTFKTVNFGVALMPQASSPKGKVDFPTNVGGTTMVILNNSSMKKKAFDFLRFLLSKEMQTIWVKELNQISVRKDVNMKLLSLFSPEMKVFLKQYEYARSRPQIPNYGDLESTINPLLYSIMDGKLDVRQGLDKACSLMKDKIFSKIFLKK